MVTRWQHQQFPAVYHDKLDVVFDGVDTDFWSPGPPTDDLRQRLQLPDGARVVTYAARGFESMRGFDIFMQVARELCQRLPDVYFVVAGEDRICYGGDERVIGQKSFLQWVLSQNEYDLSRFRFVGRVPPPQLADIFRLGDLHLYLTFPFVLSWSLINAMACGALVLASDTPPVRELITPHETGLVARFNDIPEFVAQAEAVLSNPAQYHYLRQGARTRIQTGYSLTACMPRLRTLFENTSNGRSTTPPIGL